MVSPPDQKQVVTASLNCWYHSSRDRLLIEQKIPKKLVTRLLLNQEVALDSYCFAFDREDWKQILYLDIEEERSEDTLDLTSLDPHGTSQREEIH